MGWSWPENYHVLMRPLISLGSLRKQHRNLNKTMWKQTPTMTVWGNNGSCMLISHVQSVSTVTWQRGGGGLGAGGTKELDVRGMKPASLPLLASSLGGGGKEPVRANQSPAGSVLNIKNQAIMNWWIDFVGQRAELPEFQQHKQQSVLNESLLEIYTDRLHKSSLWNDQKIAAQCLTLLDHYFITHYRTVPPRCYLFLAVSSNWSQMK